MSQRLLTRYFDLWLNWNSRCSLQVFFFFAKTPPISRPEAFLKVFEFSFKTKRNIKRTLLKKLWFPPYQEFESLDIAENVKILLCLCCHCFLRSILFFTFKSLFNTPKNFACTLLLRLLQMTASQLKKKCCRWQRTLNTNDLHVFNVPWS